MIVINPPWKLDIEARPLLDWLARALAQDSAARSKVDWLVPE
jgi:23S rRNA A2030 N6-methylase RlmJ